MHTALTPKKRQRWRDYVCQVDLSAGRKQPQRALFFLLETQLSPFVVSNSCDLVKWFKPDGILRAKPLQVQRLELRLRHESWFKAVLKNLGRPLQLKGIGIIVEPTDILTTQETPRQLTVLAGSTSFHDRFQSPERIRPSLQGRAGSRRTRPDVLKVSPSAQMIRQRLLWKVIGRRLVERLLRAGWIEPVRADATGIFYDEHAVHKALKRLGREGYLINCARRWENPVNLPV